MLSKLKYAIVVPVYKQNLTEFEEIALNQCFKVFQGCSIIAIKPEKLLLSEHRFSRSVYFDDSYFESVFGYNKLMLSASFYTQFNEYDYILIYQLDAFAFSNQMDFWCSKGYDYIGAPWLYKHNHYSQFKTFKEHLRSYFHRRYNLLGKSGQPALDKQLNNQVGNGGFSLRKIETFINICQVYKTQISEYEQFENSIFNEDIFFSIELNRRKRIVKIPSYKEAINFAIETEPEKAFKLNGDKCPFGCHGWEKNINFWRPYFAKNGYKI